MCEFCDGKLIPTEYTSGGIRTAADMISSLYTSFFGEEKSTGSGIRLICEDGENLLSFDNSANEYADGMIAINYCPMCGRKLNADA